MAHKLGMALIRQRWRTKSLLGGVHYVGEEESFPLPVEIEIVGPVSWLTIDRLTGEKFIIHMGVLKREKLLRTARGKRFIYWFNKGRGRIRINLYRMEGSEEPCLHSFFRMSWCPGSVISLTGDVSGGGGWQLTLINLCSSQRGKADKIPFCICCSSDVFTSTWPLSHFWWVISPHIPPIAPSQAVSQTRGWLVAAEKRLSIEVEITDLQRKEEYRTRKWNRKQRLVAGAD